MAVKYDTVPEADVKKELTARGYGIDHNRRYTGIALNKATGRRFQTGSFERAPCGGLMAEQYQQILKFASDPVDAANRVEAMILGKEQPPIQAAVQSDFNPAMASQPGIDLATAERLISNRVAHEVNRAIEPYLRQMQAAIKDVMSMLESRPAPKKRGRPPKVKPEAAAPEAAPQ